MMQKNDDFGTPPRWSKKTEKVDPILVPGRVCCNSATTFGQRGPQGGTLFAHEKLREKIQGKKRDDGKRALQLAVSVASVAYSAPSALRG